MAVEIITKEDLQIFKMELIKELKELLQKPEPVKPWLKSNEVQKLLRVSSGTLQNLRLKGILRFTRIGGSLYYKQEDIEKALENGLSQPKELKEEKRWG